MGISIEELNSLQIDVLREIGNIGAGNAATALSKMLSGILPIPFPSLP
jgi:chemotaxis protein CheC